MGQTAVADRKRPALRHRARGQVRRLRNAVRDTERTLAELERVESVDRFGTYEVDPDETIEEVSPEIEQFLQQAREDHPGQVLEVVVIARQGRDNRR